jgi:hypothetical protein
MIKLLLICFALFTSDVFADQDYSSDMGKSIQSIYWLNKNQDGAIVYAKHHGFVQLRNFIDTAILASHQVSNSKFNTEEAAQLLVMLPTAQKWLVVYFSADQLLYNGETYWVDPNLIKEMTQLNNYRIDKGDSISRQSLTIAKKSFGLS